MSGKIYVVVLDKRISYVFGEGGILLLSKTCNRRFLVSGVLTPACE